MEGDNAADKDAALLLQEQEALARSIFLLAQF